MLLALALAAALLQPAKGAGSHALRGIEVVNGPIFRSSSADLLAAWSDCADATENTGLHVNDNVLIDHGWLRSVMTVRGKAFGSERPFYSKPGINALISVSEHGVCAVEGLSNAPSAVDVLSAGIMKRVKEIADRRHVKFDRWTSDGRVNFSAAPFTASIRTGHPSGATILSNDHVGDTVSIVIITVDAFGSTK